MPRIPIVSQLARLPRPILLGAGAIGAVGGYYYFRDARSAVYEYVACPILRAVTDGEQGHKIGILSMKYGLSPKLYDEDSVDAKYGSLLHTSVFGTQLKTPIGCAAGLDKDGEAIESLFDSGFSYVEVGLITPEPQPGNPKPRFFRLPKDEAVINRYGFNLSGHFAVVANLKQRFNKWWNKISESEKAETNNSFRKGKLLAINLGKNKFGDEVQDYVKGVERLGPFADVLVVNVSSPNTPGLRDLQSEEKLTNLLSEVVEARNTLGKNILGRKPPVMVKIAPDLTEPEIESIANSATTSKVDGIIVSNTTIQRPDDRMLTSDSALLHQTGGLSGKPLKPISLKALRTLRKYTKNSGLVIVGCGGISNGRDALEFGKAGANFVQLYTAFAYRGPGLIAKIRDELVDELQREGKTWEEIVGSDDP